MFKIQYSQKIAQKDTQLSLNKSNQHEMPKYQAKRHKTSLLFTSFTILAFITC